MKPCHDRHPGAPRITNHSTRNLLLTGWPQREHSRKPDEMTPLIENLFDSPYLELFARTQRPGWTTWGNQTDKLTTDPPLTDPPESATL